MQGGADIVPVRLKNAVLRILSRSKYRQYYLQQPPGAACTPGAGNAPGGAASLGGPSQVTNFAFACIVTCPLASSHCRCAYSTWTACSAFQNAVEAAFSEQCL